MEFEDDVSSQVAAVPIARIRPIPGFEAIVGDLGEEGPIEETPLEEEEEEVEVEDDDIRRIPIPENEPSDDTSVGDEEEEYEEDTIPPVVVAEPQPGTTSKFLLPEGVKTFLTVFQRSIKEKKVDEISTAYETGFSKLSEKFYKTSPWPHPSVVSPIVNNDRVFLLFYKELYFRHIYSKSKSFKTHPPMPTLDQRFESWQNYMELFNLFLNPPSDLDIELPDRWLWDMVDEFIYQFQSFYQYLHKPKRKHEQEIAALLANKDAWNVCKVLHILEELVAKTRIRQLLSAGEPVKGRNLMIGFYAIIGLLRVNCLLGDYYAALSALHPIDLTNKQYVSRVTACYIAVHYYMGFASFMMRRYIDAIKTFSNILLYIHRTKQYHTRSYQYDEIEKKSQQMLSLLTMAVSLCPQRIDEATHQSMKEKYGDKLARMQRGDLAAFVEQFCFACPKFISPAYPDLNAAGSASTPGDSASAALPAVSSPAVEAALQQASTTGQPKSAALLAQLRVFLEDARQQLVVPTIRSFLKLYTTIPMAKLAGFLEIDEDTLRTYLMCFKHKSRSAAMGITGVPTAPNAASDVDFHVEKDMIHIADSKVSRRYGEYFIRHIHQFEELVSDLEKKKRR